MNLLLDTHIWIWSLLEPNRLSRKVRRLLDDPANDVWLSPISVWETLLLIEKGRLDIDRDAQIWINQALAGSGLREAPLTSEIAIASATLGLPQRDPADRFIAATAKVLGLTLVTADGHLAASKEFAVLVNR